MHFTQHINAPKEKVWHALLDDASYRIWTEGFNPAGSSYYEGDWSVGSEIRFIGPDGEGNLGGMLGVIAEHRPNEYVQIRYTGMIMNGVDDTTSDIAKSYIGGTESYRVTEKDGGTEIEVDLAGATNLPEDMQTYFKDAWPKALLKLKELAEAN